MKSKNCPNCGAVYSLEDVKCPYCGTLYYDMSAIDFTSRTPIFLKFKTPMGEITQCAIPMLGDISMSSEPTYITDNSGRTIHAFSRTSSMSTNVTFEAIPYGKNNRLCEIREVE